MKRKRKNNSKYMNVIIVVVVMASIGLAMLFIVTASTNSSGIESERGIRIGTRLVSDDPTASNNEYIQFNKYPQSIGTQRLMAEAPLWGAAIYYPIAQQYDDVDDNDEYRIHVERTGRGKKPDILRVFAGSANGVWRWPNVEDADVIGHDGATWVSFKINTSSVVSGSQNAAWTNSVKTIPTTGKPVMLTIHHEPENDAPSTGTDEWILNWIKAQIQIGKAIKAANNPNVAYGPVFMGKYYMTDISRTNPKNLHNYMKIASDNGLLDDLQSVYDFVGWDPYHEGSYKEPPQIAAPRNTAAYWYDDAEDFTDVYFPGKKFAIGETGFDNRVDETARLNWFKSIKAWVDARPGKIMAVCYYDASQGKNSWISLGTGGRLATPYQKRPAEFWGSLYKD
jgi:hypothetical protein